MSEEEIKHLITRRERNRVLREEAVSVFSGGARLTVRQLSAHLGCSYKRALHVLDDISPPHYPLSEEKSINGVGQRGPRPTIYFFAGDD